MRASAAVLALAQREMQMLLRVAKFAHGGLG
jgi:hypothetical protein